MLQSNIGKSRKCANTKCTKRHYRRGMYCSHYCMEYHSNNDPIKKLRKCKYDKTDKGIYRHHKRRVTIGEDRLNNFTAKEFREVCEKAGYKCKYCRTEVTIFTASPDHRIPIARGGSNTIDNIDCTCLWCNISKGDKTTLEYRRYVFTASWHVV